MKFNQRALWQLVLLLSGTILLSGCATWEARKEWKDLKHETSIITISNDRIPSKEDIVYPEKASTLEDYIRIGLLNNPGLKSAFYDWKAALKKIPQVTSLPDPEFTYSYYIEEVETRVGEQEQAFNVMQKFPFLGKLEARGQAALKRARQVKERYEAKKLELIYELKDAYYEYAYLSAAIRITQENKELLQNFEEVVQIKYKTGQAQNADLLKAQVELGKIANDLITLKDFKKPVVARLNAALNLSVDHSLPPPSNVNYPDTGISLRQDLSQTLYDNNPSLKQLANAVDEAKTKVYLSRLDFVPDVSVGATYIDTDARNVAGIPEDGDDPVIVMFKVNVPIWYNRLFASVDEAKSLQASKENLLADQTNRLMTKLENVLYKYQDAARQVKLYRDALILKAAQSLSAAETDYRAGRRDFLSLIDSQRTLLAFNLSYMRAQSNAAQRLAELEMLLGGDLSKDIIKEDNL